MNDLVFESVIYDNNKPTCM